MEIIEFIKFEDVRAAKPKVLYFAPNSLWWTHDGAHLAVARLGGREIIRDANTFLQAAEYNPRQFGRHGLRALMAAHHLNCYVSFDELLHTSARSWAEYNDALDRLDELKKNILRPDSPELIEKLKQWLGKERTDFFAKLYEQHGRLNVSWMEGNTPHPVHFHEGLEVRNKLRSITAYLWSNEEYDLRWEECVLRAIGKFKVRFMSKDSKDDRNRTDAVGIDLGSQEAEFFIGSIVSGSRIEPVVEFQWDDKKVQMPPEKALEMSWWMFEAANNALFDAFLYGLTINRVGAGPERAVSPADFRSYREQRRESYQRGFQILHQINSEKR